MKEWVKMAFIVQLVLAYGLFIGTVKGQHPNHFSKSTAKETYILNAGFFHTAASENDTPYSLGAFKPNSATCAVPFSTIHLLEKLRFQSRYFQYHFFERFQIIRFCVRDIIFPFHYFW